jgi:hypothetical protein
LLRAERPVVSSGVEVMDRELVIGDRVGAITETNF